MSPSRPSEASLGDADARSPQRPGTAPSAKPPKPPKLPPEGGGYPSAVLPGGALRPAQSNRMDELLTKSEVQTPDSPKQMLKVLALHGEALKRQLETQLAERENLRFQVRLLERDVREREPSFIEKQIAQLEAENHSKVAVLEEFGRLTARRSQLQSALADMEGAQVQSPALAALEASSFLAASNEVDDEDLDMARWECRRLEKRLAQARSYNCELLQDLERKPAMSTNASEETEVAALVAQNEEMLSRLRSKLRTAQGTQVSPPKVPKAPPPKGRRGGADVVEVLTIGAGPEGQDLEWQTTRAPARKP
ncbi:unnamed protein product [Durusdinium trenchii]|uniref:Uncharacterized protein n=1 Tax=Durusdinium trenchii TaxID=1381693 RepID=A0ABP0RH74_9DINO